MKDTGFIPYPETFVGRLTAALRDRGWRQKDLAAALQVSEARVSAIMREVAAIPPGWPDALVPILRLTKDEVAGLREASWLRLEHAPLTHLRPRQRVEVMRMITAMHDAQGAKHAR